MDGVNTQMVTEPERTRERVGSSTDGAHAHMPISTLIAPGFGGAPYLSYLLCRSFSIWGSTVVHRSSFHRELERQLSMMPSAIPDHPALLLFEATYAFWLTMFRRSTTTDRSLMATAESTDVCRQVPLRG